jgi:hypothetical protein
MLGRSRSQAIKDNAVSSGGLALALARDQKFREQLGAAIAHGVAARRRAASRIGLMAAAARLAADEELRSELTAAVEAIQAARQRVDKKRSHTMRTTLLIVAGSAGVLAPSSSLEAARAARGRRHDAEAGAGRARTGPGDRRPALMPNRREVVSEQLEELRTDLDALWVALTHDPKKEARKERAWTIFAGIFGAVAAIGARKVAMRAWDILTGEPPPHPQARQPKPRR